MTWKLEHRQGEKWKGSGGWEGTYGETKWTAKVRFAGQGNEAENGAEVEERTHYNGSGSQTFGGAESWPSVLARVDLPAGREDLRAELSAALRETIEAFIMSKGLAVK